MTNSELLLYQTTDGQVKIEVRLEEESVWLTQDQMAQLFGKAKSTINEHIKNVFSEGELIEKNVTKKFGISEFQQKQPNFYNLDVIINYVVSKAKSACELLGQSVSDHFADAGKTIIIPKNTKKIVEGLMFTR